MWLRFGTFFLWLVIKWVRNPTIIPLVFRFKMFSSIYSLKNVKSLILFYKMFPNRIRCFDIVNENLYFVVNKPRHWLKQICFSQSHGLFTTKYKFSLNMSKHLILKYISYAYVVYFPKPNSTDDLTSKQFLIN